MKKYDKSLTEVWEWKEKVYKNVKDLTPEDYIERIKSDADKILTDNRIKLTSISLKKKYQKVA